MFIRTTCCNVWKSTYIKFKNVQTLIAFISAKTLITHKSNNKCKLKNVTKSENQMLYNIRRNELNH